MPNLLILTVGTGTAGRQSNIAAGLRRTIELTTPRAFWLVPSTSEDSLLVADLVRDGLASFIPVSSSIPYTAVAAPDDLESCRQTLRAVIQRARAQLRPGEKLLINPTSGTKQMTAAATLAALDEGLGDISFTVGDRADGVVITGTERLTSFDPASFFRERDLAQARHAAELGAYAAAERLLAPHRALLPREHATTECLKHWLRQDYAAAASAAARFDDTLRRHLKQLEADTAANLPTPAILADLLAWAGHHHRLGDADASLNLAYKTVELAGRLRLHERTGLLPPYRLEATDQWEILPELKARFRQIGRNGSVFLGLTQTMQALDQMGDALGHDFQTDPRYFYASQARNELTHAIAPVSSAQSQRLLDLARNLIEGHISLPAPFPRPRP